MEAWALDWFIDQITGGNDIPAEIAMAIIGEFRKSSRCEREFPMWFLPAYPRVGDKS
jgi:hypothetical protein